MGKETTAQRLRKIMNLKHLRQVDVVRLCEPYSEKFGVKIRANDLCQYLAGRSLPNQKRLSMLGLALGVSEIWLMGINVPMQCKLVHGDENNVAASYVPDNIYYFPVIASVKVGWDGAVEEIDSGDLVPIPIEFLKGHKPSEFMVFQIRGNSMYPRLLNGDKVLVLRTDSVDSGATAVVMYNGEEATVKKVTYAPGGDWLDLTPANPEYQTKHIVGADLEQCRVIGKVIMLLRTEF